MGAKARVRAFVQGTLGCTCPDALFETANIEFAPQVPDALFEIAVAGRLLVRCYRVGEAADLAASLPAWVAAGRAARDGKGMHRFRLALATEAPQRVLEAASAALEGCREGDERVHVHVLPLADLQPLFALSC
jgi:hypothetical protein